MLVVGGDRLSTLSGSLTVTSSDPAATDQFVQALVDTAGAQGPPVRSVTVGELKGFELADPNSPARATILGGDRLVLAVDAEDAGDDSAGLAAASGEGYTLGEDASFVEAGAALGNGYAPMLYLDVKGATKLVKSVFGESSTPIQVTEAERYVSRIRYIVAGTREDPERILQRLVIGATDE